MHWLVGLRLWSKPGLPVENFPLGLASVYAPTPTFTLTPNVILTLTLTLSLRVHASFTPQKPSLTALNHQSNERQIRSPRLKCMDSPITAARPLLANSVRLRRRIRRSLRVVLDLQGQWNLEESRLKAVQQSPDRHARRSHRYVLRHRTRPSLMHPTCMRGGCAKTTWQCAATPRRGVQGAGNLG